VLASERLRQWAHLLRRDVLALSLAARDPHPGLPRRSGLRAAGDLGGHPPDAAIFARRTSTRGQDSIPTAPDQLGWGRSHPGPLGPRRRRDGLVAHMVGPSLPPLCKITRPNPWS
jgi:hypothetical protein